jgi:hypothetical protein
MFLVEDGEDPLELWDWVSRAKSLADLLIRAPRLTQINMNCDGIATFSKGSSKRQRRSPLIVKSSLRKSSN